MNASETPYQIDGEFVIAGPSTAVGWHPDLQGGHLIAALLAHLIEDIPTLTPMLTTRCVVDLTRAVPVKPLRWRREIVREGKKLQVVRAALSDPDNGLEYASLTALRARFAESPTVPLRTWPAPDTMPMLSPRKSVPGRELRGYGQEGTGVGTVWSRCTVPIIADRPTTAFMHAMSLADFGNGMANAYSLHNWNLPNIDIVVMFFRPPAGEWLLLDAVTESHGNGLGLTSSTLADKDGAFARAHQTLFIDPSGR